MEDDSISQIQTNKKPCYPIAPRLRSYLFRYAREKEIPVSYERLLSWVESAPLYDAQGRDTLWETVVYPPEQMRRLSRDLTQIYAILKTEGDYRLLDHLYADRIDYCTFGNSNPFRIRIVNAYNDNQDYYYIKKADASRAYGLELEHLLSPNRIFFLTCGNTLIEEHIVGLPGDVFIDKWLENSNFKKVRLSKELIKFNERCFIRLLGDMRSYNFVVDMTPDFEEVQIKIRAMDFDHQSYSGRMNFYRPQFFKENNPLVFFCSELLNKTTARQYQREERAMIYRRMLGESVAARLQLLLDCMCEDYISPREKVLQLRESLAEHHRNPRLLKCEGMGEILRENLAFMSKNIHKSLSGTTSTEGPFPF